MITIVIVRLKCSALSKWAVEALAEALRLELYNFDIKVWDSLTRSQIQRQGVGNPDSPWIPKKVSILEPGNYLGGTQILNNKRVKELTDK